MNSPSADSFSRDRSRSKIAIAGLLLFIALALGVTRHPLAVEEPNRSMVGLEMFFSGDYVLPTVGGLPFFDHPPLFGAVVSGFYWLFGVHHWVVRVVCLFSFVGLGVALFTWLRKVQNVEWALLSTFFLFMTGDLLLYYSTVGEMDIFFGVLVFMALRKVYDVAQNEAKARDFLEMYFWAAFGYLAKGPAALVFLGLTLVGYFTYLRNWKGLFQIRHFLGIGFFALLVGLYYGLLYHRGILAQSLEATREIYASKVVNFSLTDHVIHFFKFPIEFLIALLPVSIFPLLAPPRSLRALPEVVVFSLIAMIAGLLPYLLSPAASVRFVYPIFPFAVLVATHCFTKRVGPSPLPHRRWKVRFLAIAIFFNLLAFVGVYIGASHWGLTFRWWEILGLILFSLGLGAVSRALLQEKTTSRLELVTSLFLFLVAVRLGFDFTILPYRQAHDDVMKTMATKALTYQEKVGVSPNPYFEKYRALLAYLEHQSLKTQPLYWDIPKQQGAYFFAKPRADESLCEVERFFDAPNKQEIALYRVCK